MSYRNTLNNTIVSRGGGTSTGGSSSNSIFGRVVGIILDENHPQYLSKGGGLAINGVFYRPLTKDFKEIAIEDLPFAYQSAAHIKTVPILGEIVEIVEMPNPALSNGGGLATRKYYKQIVNIWNNPNSNVYPDIFTNPNIDITVGGAFKELGDVNPIRSTPGDVQIEGRQGQSIRFTGGKGSGNPWVDGTNLGKPVIIISNGQSQTDNGFTTLGESVDEDSCSIYMVSDHQINLTPADLKRDACDENPVESNQFKGSQIILNGGRLYFNAKQSDIQLSSITSIGMNTGGSVNIDATSYFCVDAPQIFLGSKARSASQTRKEPVLLGNQTEQLLEDIIKELQDISKKFILSSDAILKEHGASMTAKLQRLRDRVKPNGQSPLKSTKVFTE